MDREAAVATNTHTAQRKYYILHAILIIIIIIIMRYTSSIFRYFYCLTLTETDAFLNKFGCIYYFDGVFIIMHRTVRHRCAVMLAQSGRRILPQQPSAGDCDDQTKQKTRRQRLVMCFGALHVTEEDTRKASDEEDKSVGITS